MVVGIAKPLDEKRLSLYSNEYYERTDVVYRFAAVLSMSRDGAERVTEEVYRMLLADFERVSPSTDAVSLLMALTWKAWQKLKSERFNEWAIPLMATLKTMSIESRAVLYVVDMVGMDADEAAKVFGTDEKSVRKLLSDARNRMASGSLKFG